MISGADMNRRQFLKNVGLVAAAMQIAPLAAGVVSSKKHPNVLFIAVDDMADWVGCLGGHPDVKTPNIDSLASRGVLFTRAHCVSPICGPSRASVLTGMRPETTGVYHNKGTYIDYVPDAVSLPKYLRTNGYHVMGAGKINHAMGKVVDDNWDEYGPDCGAIGGPFTYDELSMEGMDPTKHIDRGKLKCDLPMNGISLIDRPTNKYSTFDWGPVDVSDDEMPDGQIANWAAGQLKKKYTKPFFLATGFYRPHQPFFVPRKYFDMYDVNKVTLPPTIAGDLEDMSQTAKYFAHLAWTSGCHKTVAKHNQWRQAVRGYLATISFADAQVGKVVKALDESEYANDTWIVLWSDHGWHLGEKEHWGKHTPWQRSTRVPMLIVPPKSTAPAGFRSGKECGALVSLLDLYPTVIDMCSLSTRSELEGKSLLTLVDDPDAKWNDAAVISIGRGNHSVCTERWKYIHYYDGSEELYDLNIDPNEWFNLANESEYAGVMRTLAKKIPIDKRFKQFVRFGRWKAVIGSDDKMMLFDILAPHGISEQEDSAMTNPAIVKKIADYLTANNINARHVMMTDEEDKSECKG